MILSIKVAPIRLICDDAHVLIYNPRVNPECDEFIKRSSLNFKPAAARQLKVRLPPVT